MKQLSSKQRRTIEALITAGSRRAACEAVGIGSATLYRWLQQTSFRQALVEAEAAALADLQRRLLSLAEKATTALEDALAADDLRQRLRAADLVLSRMLQLREAVQIEERLQRLEEIVGDGEAT